jgi:hypothetical protein
MNQLEVKLSCLQSNKKKNASHHKLQKKSKINNLFYFKIADCSCTGEDAQLFARSNPAMRPIFQLFSQRQKTL